MACIVDNQQQVINAFDLFGDEAEKLLETCYKVFQDSLYPYKGFIDLLFALLFWSIVRNTLIMAEIPSISFISQDMKEDYGKSSTQKNWKRKQRQKENGTRAVKTIFGLLQKSFLVTTFR